MPGLESSRGQVRTGLPSAEDLPVDPEAPAAPPLRPSPARQWDVLALVALGGGLGSVARYELGHAWPTPTGGFPWATFTINVLGSLALGALMVYVLEVWPPSRYRRPFLGVGIIGGFTTFSTYMNETRGLLATGHLAVADAYALTSLIAGLAAVWSGIVLARRACGLPVRRGPSRRAQAGGTAVVPPVAGSPATVPAIPQDSRPPAEGNPR